MSQAMPGDGAASLAEFSSFVSRVGYKTRNTGRVNDYFIHFQLGDSDANNTHEQEHKVLVWKQLDETPSFEIITEDTFDSRVDAKQQYERLYTIEGIERFIGKLTA